MKAVNFSRHALSISAVAAFLAGCGGSGNPSLFAPTAQRLDGASWIAPNAASQDLLYTTNVGYVSVYSYPQGKLEGTLTGFGDASGACTDKIGDVFITDYLGSITEYAHGGRLPKKVLRSPHGSPLGCSVDATTGNLAVAATSYNNSAVEVYAHAHGPPKSYKDAFFKSYYYCGYDDKGDLFVDGITSGGTFAFAELPSGGSTLQTVTLNQNIGWPDQVQWDGKHITIGDQTAPVIYAFTIKGSQGIRVGTTRLSHATYLHQSWIEGQTLIAPVDYYKNRQRHTEIVFYKYPAGGKPIEVISHSEMDGPNSAAVSLAPVR